MEHNEPLTWHDGDMHSIIDGPRFGLQEPAFRDYVAHHCLGLRPGARLADVGCGSAGSTLSLLPYILPGGALTAFDRDNDVLGIAAEKAAKMDGGEAVQFVNADALDLPVADASFDVTWCQTVLMHVPDPDKALDEMIRITKPGGVVAATEPDWTSATVTHFNTPMPRSAEEFAQWAHAYALIMEGGRRRSTGDWAIGSRVIMMMRERGLDKTRLRIMPASWMVAPHSSGRASDRALHMTLALFSPDTESQLYDQQQRNFRAAGGTGEEWARFTALRAREMACIMASHAADHAILQVNCPAFLTTACVPVLDGLKPSRQGEAGALVAGAR